MGVEGVLKLRDALFGEGCVLTVCAGNEASQPECILAEGEGEHMHDSHQIGFQAHHLPCLPTSAMSPLIYPNTSLFVFTLLSYFSLSPTALQLLLHQ